MISTSLFYSYKKVFTLMNIWMLGKKSMEFEKEDFYSHLNIKDICDVGYRHAKRVCKDCKLKN